MTSTTRRRAPLGERTPAPASGSAAALTGAFAAALVELAARFADDEAAITRAKALSTRLTQLADEDAMFATVEREKAPMSAGIERRVWIRFGSGLEAVCRATTARRQVGWAPVAALAILGALGLRNGRVSYDALFPALPLVGEGLIALREKWGARAMGLENEIGSLEIGKRADVIVVDLNRLHSTPKQDVISSLVYSAQPSDVRVTIIDGRVVMRDRELMTMDEGEVIEEANREAIGLRERAGISD